MHIKQITALLLTVVMMLGLMTGFAQAADSEEEALGEIGIINGGESLSCLAVNGRVQTLNYVYYEYPSAQGYTKQIPAYCVNPTEDGVPQVVGPGQSVRYLAEERTSDPKIMGIVANGYPTKSLGELGLQSAVEGYYATKIALWCYIIPGWDVSGVTVNPNLSGAARTQAERVLTAVQNIYKNGSWWNSIPSTGLTATADQEYAYPVTIDGVAYKQQIITVHSETWVCNYEVQVAFADPGAVPDGTRIVNLDNQDISVITTTNTGQGYDGQFKVLYPADSVQGENGSVQFTLRADVYRYGVYYASCAEVDQYGNIQNYICDTDPTRSVGVSAISKYAATEVPEDTPDPDTALKIVKVESGTETPLAGAVFEVKGPDGDVIGSFSTGTDGTILLPLTQSGTYTVTEVTPPADHLLSENPTQTVTVSYGKVSTVTFENDPYGSLRVEKISDTGDGLQGVTIQIKHIESGKTYTQKTTAGGAAFFDQLLPGAYEVRETAGIEGWQADTETVKTVTVTTGDTVTITLKNKELPGLRILKYDRQTMEAMPDVTFEIFRNTVSLGIFQTNRLGEILLTDLEPGTYRVEERHTGDEEHIVEAMPQEIELEAGDGILQLVFFNSRKPGLRLVKVDSENPSKVIPNAVFEIKSVDGSFGPQEFTTDENGEIDLSNLEPGAYVVTEKSCPGYVVDDAQRIIQLDPDETGEFVFTNSIRPSLRLVKYSADGTPLAGVTFRIAKIEDGSHYLDRTTNDQGEILISDLEPGVYSVKETATVTDHILDPTEHHVELFPGRTSTITIQNDKRPNLTIWKHDADTGEPVEGTVFLVKAADGHSVTEVRTGQDGSVTVENLLPGVYEVVEQSVSEPYLLDAPSQMITLHPNRDGALYFENHKKPNLTIQKVDSITGNPIQGAKFQIWYASNATETGELNDLGIYYTDENGQILLSGLQDGWYRAEELEPAHGYQMPEDAVQQVFVEAGTSQTLTFQNTPLSALVIWKYDSETGEALEGAVFQIKYLGGTSGTGGTVIGTYKTSVNGSFTVTGLEAGTYIVEEIAAPDGHIIDTAPQTVYLSGQDQDVVQLYFGNAPMGSLLIKKIDSATQEPLSDVEFLVTTSDGTVVGSANGKFTTDSAGTVLIEGIDPGTTLVVRETRARDGYLLDDTPQTVQIRAGETVTLEFRNQPEGNLIIHKLDSETKKPLEGVQFQITYADGSYVPDEGGQLSSNGLYWTDENGQIVLSGITGTLVVTEVETIPGYVIHEETRSQTVVVNPNDTQELYFYNDPVSGILIHKIDADTREGIYGVKFLLYDERRNPVGEFVSDQNGYVHISTADLPDGANTSGRFYLRELEAAEGYILDEEYKTVYVRPGHTAEIEWVNEAVTGQIQIYKYAAEYNTITGTPAGTPLQGAVYEISNARTGKVVDYITTDARGVAASKPLPLTRYKIVEVTAPAYWQIDPTVHDVTLEFEGQIIKLSAYDKPANLGVSVTKRGNTSVLAGSTMRYDFTIANTSNVALENFYFHDRIPTDVARATTLTTGTYSARLNYRILYKTNVSATYQVLASNLLTSNNYSFALSAIPLQAGEVVTDFYFDFGKVPVGFQSVQGPTLFVAVNGSTVNGYQMVNRSDVGGRYQGTWQTAQASWVTIIQRLWSTPELPKTGY